MSAITAVYVAIKIVSLNTCDKSVISEITAVYVAIKTIVSLNNCDKSMMSAITTVYVATKTIVSLNTYDKSVMSAITDIYIAIKTIISLNNCDKSMMSAITAVYVAIKTIISSNTCDKSVKFAITAVYVVILNKSWKQHPTKQLLCGHLTPITKTIQVRRTKHAKCYWGIKDELISDILLWTPSYGRAKAGRPARTYIQQLRADTVCSFEDLPEAMDDRDGWRERVRKICAGGAAWWRCYQNDRQFEHLQYLPNSLLVFFLTLIIKLKYVLMSVCTFWGYTSKMNKNRMSVKNVWWIKKSIFF